jgi:hypothetical protein
MLSREERTKLFLQRLAAAEACASSAEALALLSTTLDAIEDEFTSIPNNPANWESDGRLYPPREDSRRTVPGRSDVVRYRSRKHNTLIAANGAIQIIRKSELCLDKPGADGLTITALMGTSGSGN